MKLENQHIFHACFIAIEDFNQIYKRNPNSWDYEDKT